MLIIKTTSLQARYLESAHHQSSSLSTPYSRRIQRQRHQVTKHEKRTQSQDLYSALCADVQPWTAGEPAAIPGNKPDLTQVHFCCENCLKRGKWYPLIPKSRLDGQRAWSTPTSKPWPPRQQYCGLCFTRWDGSSNLRVS